MPTMARHFKQELKCKFTFVEDEDIDVGEYINYAKSLKEMGVPIDMKKFKELTKLQFIALGDDEQSQVWQPEEKGNE